MNTSGPLGHTAWNHTYLLDLTSAGLTGGVQLSSVSEAGEEGSDLTAGNASQPQWSNASLEEYLALRLGPRRGVLYEIVPLTVIYCIIFVTGIVGNVCTCIVIARNKYMQTATNYYLFNLAIADLLVLVLGLPLETYTFWSAYPWIFGEPFCVVRTMAAETSTYASILTITAFTVERYVAICHPMRSQTMSSLTRAIKVIIGIWVASAICSIPTVLQFGIVYQNDVQEQPIMESATCSIKAGRHPRHIFEVSTFLFFFTPMTIITVLYALIGLAIRRSTLSRAGSDSSTHSNQTGSDLRAQAQARARRAVLKMLGEPPRQRTSTWVYCRTHPHAIPRPTLKASTLQALRTLVAVVVAFFICWAPFHTQRLMTMYIRKDSWTHGLKLFQYVLYSISGILYYLSSTINPILYNIMSLKFRQAFKNTIFRSCRKRKRQTNLGTYKFYNRQPGTDTHLTLINGQSPLANCNLKRQRRGLQNPNYVTGPKSNSSSLSGSSGAHMLRDEPLDNIELDRMMLTDSKSLSLHPSPRATINHNFRPFHSYA